MNDVIRSALILDLTPQALLLLINTDSQHSCIVHQVVPLMWAKKGLTFTFSG